MGKFSIVHFLPTPQLLRKQEKTCSRHQVMSCSLQSDFWWKVCQPKAYQQHSAAELSKFKPALHQRTTYQWNALQREQTILRISLSYLNQDKLLHESIKNEHLIFCSTSLLWKCFVDDCISQQEKTSFDSEKIFCKAHCPNLTFKMKRTDTSVKF